MQVVCLSLSLDKVSTMTPPKSPGEMSSPWCGSVAGTFSVAILVSREVVHSARLVVRSSPAARLVSGVGRDRGDCSMLLVPCPAHKWVQSASVIGETRRVSISSEPEWPFGVDADRVCYPKLHDTIPLSCCSLKEEVVIIQVEAFWWQWVRPLYIYTSHGTITSPQHLCSCVSITHKKGSSCTGLSDGLAE